MSLDARLIGPIERLLYLRTLPTIGDLPPNELAAVAHFTRERSFRKGELMLREGEPTSSVFFLVEGRASMRRAGRLLREVEAPFVVGFLPVLAHDPNGVEVRAEVDTLALELGANELLEAFEDSFSMLEGGIRQLSKQLVEIQHELEVRGLLEREAPIETPYPEGELDLVQRLLLMRKTGPYRQASLDPLIEMARRAAEVRYEPGDVLWVEGEPSTWGMHVAHGVVRCTGDGGERVFRMGPGSVVGYIETYAGLPRSYEAVAETRVVGLRGDTEAFFDALEDNFELGMAFIGFLAQLLTRLYDRLAESAPAE